MSKRTLVTAALPYANGPIHLGHLAGAYLPADLFVRYKRLQKEDIVYICGSDEHGVPITIAAEKEGISPQEIVDRFHSMNKDVFEKFGISFDYFGRTSSAQHHETAQQFFKKLNKKNVFKKKTEEQLYDEQADMFLPDRYVIGTCPNCGYEEAYGDQCEQCGSALSPNELKNPRSTITGNKPVLKETEHWYLPLGDWQDKLEKWINSQDDWKPNVLGQCKSWLNEGLSDRAVTRDLKWGVPVPLEEAHGKVLYVWFDAPIGYITATKEWAEKQGDKELWKTYWQDDDTDLIHFIGKDNIVFHCIIFPTMLMADGDYILPENVPANEFLNLEGRKLSTSRGWAVWLHEYLEDFQADYLRYVLGTNLPETKDSDFSWNDFQNKVNNELADILGNFIFRTLSFTGKYFEGKVPELIEPTERDLEVLKEIENSKERIAESYERYRFREAIQETMNLARTGNKYFTEMEPWKTRKDDPVVCGNTLHVSAQISAALSVLFDPILPQKMKQLRTYLGITEDISWDMVTENMLEVGSAIDKGEILFNKIEDEVVEEQINKLKERAKENEDDTSGREIQPIKDNIQFDDFMKLDLRVGKITEAEDLPKSNKLIKLTVDIGLEERTILAGIKKHFKPEEIVGNTVSVVANLAPKKMMGIPSEGMVLMSEDDEGNLSFMKSDGQPGDIIR
ncbi:MAG: methionine--tRNA ligase [Bacteroidota bacterium]